MQALAASRTGIDQSLPPKRRTLGHSVLGGEVITGVLLHQTRSGAGIACTGFFAKLRQDCTAFAEPVLSGALTPFGRAPTFNPSSPGFEPDLIGQEASFFNMSVGSPELSAAGFPYAFFPRTMSGLRGQRDGFPVVWEVRWC